MIQFQKGSLSIVIVQKMFSIVATFRYKQADDDNVILNMINIKSCNVLHACH